MGLFSKEKKVRRPVAEIVSGLTGMVEDLREARAMAADEQTETEAAIDALVAQRAVLVTEQNRAAAVEGNLSELLGLDLDGDGEPDDLSRAIANWRAQEEADDDNILGIDIEGDDLDDRVEPASDDETDEPK